MVGNTLMEHREYAPAPRAGVSAGVVVAAAAVFLGQLISITGIVTRVAAARHGRRALVRPVLVRDVSGDHQYRLLVGGQDCTPRGEPRDQCFLSLIGAEYFSEFQLFRHL